VAIDLPADLTDAINKYDQKANSFVEALMKFENKTKPELIFHYTDDVGLKGILETGVLWVSDLFHLNDPSELTHGFSLSVDVLKNKTTGINDEEVRAFVSDFNRFRIEEAAHFFVCCFSGNGDDLGQWRAYADNGQGYALGFQRDLLEEAFIAEDNCHTFPITYNDTELKELQEKIVEYLIEVISLATQNGYGEKIRAEYRNTLSTFHALNSIAGVIVFKHEAYAHEKEYRFLEIHRRTLKPPGVKYRMRPYSLVRYKEFHWRKTTPQVLKKIIIGPSADKLRAHRFAKDCVEAYQTAFPIAIEQSEIPYRLD
jgi:Protein of unknown function (DUF2971)